MARPKKSYIRNRQLNVRLSEREFAWLRARANAAGIAPAEFGRRQLLFERPARARPQAAPGQLEPLFMAHVSRIGSNLNQVARRLNQFDVPPPLALDPLLDAIRDILRKGSLDGS